ncbi:hypothetical protein FACS189452_00040 [Bacteroidia bacterium]|nr:hypothetical protein FACS189452_00040 [Bacteroidia bacterium]GHT80131.1 hypothetical protein FACS189467_1450 [Bacteroidia bacterium]
MKPYLFLSLLFIAASCEERVIIETDNQTPKLVISAIIRTDTGAQSVYLSQSVRYFGGDSVPRISNAQVWIDDQPLTAVDTVPGEFRTADNFFAEANKTHTLRVQYNGKTYTATSDVPNTAQVHRMFFFDVLKRQRPPFAIFTPLAAPGEQYIGADVYYNNRKLSRNLGNYPVGEIPQGEMNHDTISAGLYNVGNRSILGENDTLYTCPFDTIRMQIHVLNAATYNFITAAKNELSSSNPMFGGPPANVPSNIVGDGAVGCFGTVAVSPMMEAVLPLSVLSLETGYVMFSNNIWVDSVTNAQLTFSAHDSLARHSDGSVYFKLTAINPDIRGFDAVDVNGSLLQFTMKSYQKFYRRDRENEVWVWTRK